MNRYLTIGDVHGNQVKWMNRIEPILESGDSAIITGDFGAGFWDGIYLPEEMFYDYIEEKDYNVLFVDGNHEDFDKLNKYPVEEWNGGKVHYIRRNIIHLMRGEVYDIEGFSLFVFGGGYSLDRSLRKKGFDWWPDELPSSVEYENGVNNLAHHCNRVDYVITHTAPHEVIPGLIDNQNEKKQHVQEERELNEYLQKIKERIEFKKWYFGHFHVDMTIDDNIYCLWNDVRELQTGRPVRIR